MRKNTISPVYLLFITLYWLLGLLTLVSFTGCGTFQVNTDRVANKRIT